MFSSGMLYVRCDFHLHTHKDKEFTYLGEPNSFVKDYVSALEQSGISIGIITNHNKFDKGEYDAIRKAARKEKIFILPGVELTVKEGANGVHTLIVFNPSEWLENGNNHIQTFLTSAFATISNPENSNTKCTFDLKNTLEKLEEYNRDYFVIFAHVDQNSGLFAECKGGLLSSLSSIAPFRKRVLGLQKSALSDNVKKFQQYFGYLPALVQGSDPKSISDIGKGSTTYLKIGEQSYSAVKFALQDNADRVSHYIPGVKHGFIESIEFQGGKFDGQKIFFSSNLNTLIGIRGSGKSAVLEIIRYALGLKAQTDMDYKKELVKNMLGSGGKATLSVFDKHKKHYFISIILGGEVCIVDENGECLNVSPLSIFDGIQYFGQKDLSNSADHENSLLEKLVSKKVRLDVSVDDCAEKISTVVSELLAVSKIPDQLTEATAKKSEIEHKMSIFKEKGVAEKLKKQATYDKDKDKLIHTKDNIHSIIEALTKVYENNDYVSTALENYGSEYNGELIEDGKKILKLIDKQLLTIKDIIQNIQTQENNFSVIVRKLIERINELSDEFAAIKREIKDETLNADTYLQLNSNAEKIKDILKRLEEKSKSKSVIESDFNKAAQQRNDVLLQIFRAYQAEVTRINSSQDKLRIEIVFKGNREEFKTRLRSDFRGTGISDSKYQVMSETFSDYVSLIEDWILNDGKKLKEILTTSEYGKLDTKLREQYAELLKYQVPNKVDIYYHDKLLKKHSLGQRASALILFILTQDNNDIIFIDQPEDDLDNKVIYDEVIRAISKRKTDIQFIFATHNANIPVLGDSEKVIVMEYQDTRIDIKQGNIDSNDTHAHIVDIMEGGKDAFERRQLIYETWR